MEGDIGGGEKQYSSYRLRTDAGELHGHQDNYSKAIRS